MKSKFEQLTDKLLKENIQEKTQQTETESIISHLRARHAYEDEDLSKFLIGILEDLEQKAPGAKKHLGGLVSYLKSSSAYDEETLVVFLTKTLKDLEQKVPSIKKYLKEYRNTIY